METPHTDEYDVLFAAQCVEGHAPDQVRDALGRLFRADAQTLDKLFSGQPQRIKSRVDAATADKYRQAMAAAGAVAILRPCAVSEGPAPPPEGALSIEPPGSDVLRPEERRVIDAAAPDTSHLSVAAAGVALGDGGPAAEAAVEAPDYAIAALGADLGPQTQAEAPSVPDTSGLSVSDAPLDLSDCAPPPASAPDLDLDQFSLGQPGDNLLPDALRGGPEVSVPDTSHLSLENADPNESDRSESS